MRRLLILLLLLLVPTGVWAQGQLIPGNRTLAGTMNAGSSGGTATAYTLTLDPPITAYVADQFFVFRAHVANTGPATLAVNGVAAVPLRKWRSGVLVDLISNDIRTGQEVLVYYDGTSMQALSLQVPPVAVGGTGTLQVSDGSGGLASYAGSYCPEGGGSVTGVSSSGTVLCGGGGTGGSGGGGGSTGTTAPVLLTQASSSAPNGVNLGALPAGLLGTTVSNNVATMQSVPRPAGALVGTTEAQTLENKSLITRRVALADSATLTIDLNSMDLAVVTELSQATTIQNPTGTADAGKLVRWQLHSTTPQSLTWGSLWGSAAGFALPTSTTGGTTYDHVWFQYNSAGGKFDLVYSSQLSQFVQPTGVASGTYTCPTSLTVDTRGRLAGVIAGTCGGGGGGGGGGTASAAGGAGDVQFYQLGNLAADPDNLTYDPVTKALVTPNVLTSRHRAYYVFQDVKGRKQYLTSPPLLTNTRHITLPDQDGELCVKGGACAGGAAGPSPTGDDQVQVSDSASGSTWRTLPNCADTGGQHLNYTAATNTWSCGTSNTIGTLPSADDQVLVSDSASGSTWRTLPNCLDSGGAHLNYNQATNSWICGSTTGGAAGSVSISGTPAAGQAAEWASGSAITGVATSGTGSYVKATTPVLTSPTIAKLANLTTNGLVQTSGGDGTLSVNTSTFVVDGGVQSLTSSTTYTCPRNSTRTQCKMALTAATGTLTIAAPTGTPVDGDLLMMRLRCTNAQTYNFNAIFLSSPNIALPTTCPASTTQENVLGFLYSSDLTKWQLIALN